MRANVNGASESTSGNQADAAGVQLPMEVHDCSAWNGDRRQAVRSRSGRVAELVKAQRRTGRGATRRDDSWLWAT